jgi:hypothetical protein
MNKINNIIIHCSDSGFGNANMIRSWHKERGWRDIGYHFIILNGQITKNFYLNALNGSISVGRELDENNYLSYNEIGAHTLGYNKSSIGICLIGINIFTVQQFDALIDLVAEFMELYEIPIKNVLGHYETERAKGKTCPNIDMDLFRLKLSKRE